VDPVWFIEAHEQFGQHRYDAKQEANPLATEAFRQAAHSMAEPRASSKEFGSLASLSSPMALRRY